jgi:hypothetical protein
MNEPSWRKALCWCAVVSFFSAPLLFFTVEILSIMVPSWHTITKDEISELKWLADWHRMLAALVFGLAGLNSFDKWKGNGSTKA